MLSIQKVSNIATKGVSRRSLVARSPLTLAKRNMSAKAAFDLKPPPYALDALEPHMSKETLDYHWGKHHRAYNDMLNKLVAGTALETKSLDEVVVASWNNGNPTPVFNQAAQVWNHTFFWESMKPNGGGVPSGKLAEAIDRDFGSFDKFKDEFKNAGATQFGSGWAWLLVDREGKLSISKTPNAVNPITEGKTAVLTMDVWEHAYYIDYRNARPNYMGVFVEKLVNWDVVAERYAAATA
uniref:Superoxide dismutase n=2 Tax=Polytomella parva TaxID=51329 RepID=A0A7S0YJF9_9CHLO|mmetsp:Transcript_24139/g.43189  ORF Transcript_24139/g.43189 Transcript_24139/m.43189 type:complete len:239 (+) Transcript_24139:103-819(+)